MARVRPLTAKPLIVKLTPNVVRRRCRSRAAAEAGGADALSLINTLRAHGDRSRAPAQPWLGAGQRRPVRAGGASRSRWR